MKGAQCNLIEPVALRIRGNMFESQESTDAGWVCKMLSVVVSAD